MIKPCRQYIVDEVQPRLKEICFGPEVFISMAIGVISGIYIDKWDFGRIEIKDIAGAVLTYSAIALGFCLAGMTLSLTLPDNGFAKLLATNKAKGANNRDQSMYSQ